MLTLQYTNTSGHLRVWREGSSYDSSLGQGGAYARLESTGDETRGIVRAVSFEGLPDDAVVEKIEIEADLLITRYKCDGFTFGFYFSSFDPSNTVYTAEERFYSARNEGASSYFSSDVSTRTRFKFTYYGDIPSYVKNFKVKKFDLVYLIRSVNGGTGGWYGYASVHEKVWVTFYYHINQAPNKPTSNNITTSSSKPSLTFSLSDPDGDYLKAIDVQVSTSTNFSSGNIVWQVSEHPISSRTSASVTVGTNLTPRTYYFRARVRDEYGKWSSWSNTYTLTVNSPPNTPIVKSLFSKGYTLNRYPKFFFTVSDPDGHQITDIQVEVGADPGFATVVRNTSQMLISGLPANSGSTVVAQIADNPLSPGTYYLRARCKDSVGTWGNWSTGQAFTVASPPWEDTIPLDATIFKAEWMNQIAEAINAARQFRGLPIVEFTDGTIIPQQHDIKAIHVAERQKALQEVLTTIGVWEEICPDGGAELGTARYKGGAYRTNADKYVGSYCHALLTNEDWNGLYLVPSSGYTLYPGIVYRVAAMIKNPTPQSGYINLFTAELWTNSGLEAKIIPAGMDWTLYEWFFTVEEIKTVSHLRIEESGFNGYSGEIYLDLLTLRPAWTHELNLLATTVLEADADWSKWQHYKNTSYWDTSSQYNHELYGRVFQGQAVTGRTTTYLYFYGSQYYPFAVKEGQPYLFGLWVKLSPGQTASATVTAYFRKPDDSNLVRKDRQVTLTQDWQYLEFDLTPTRSMNVGVGWAFTGIQGLTLHAAMPVVRPLVDRSGVHIQELRDYLTQA